MLRAGFEGLGGRLRPTPRCFDLPLPMARLMWALAPHAPPLRSAIASGTAYVGACAPRPAAGWRCPLHPRWGPFHFPQTPLK
jgi:hypothetical protein